MYVTLYVIQVANPVWAWGKDMRLRLRLGGEVTFIIIIEERLEPHFMLTLTHSYSLTLTLNSQLAIHSPLTDCTVSPLDIHLHIPILIHILLLIHILIHIYIHLHLHLRLSLSSLVGQQYRPSPSIHPSIHPSSLGHVL